MDKMCALDAVETKNLIKHFYEQFPNSPIPSVAWAPGRVNLLGEHTDYNEGFVFPMAINSGIFAIGALNTSTDINLYSINFASKDNFSVHNIFKNNSKRWTNYVRGVCHEFQVRGLPLRGFNLLLVGDLPQGAGLSSSAALEVAVACLINNLHAWDLEPIDLIKIAQRAENDFVGVASGIMDQFASMMGKENHGVFLDCRTYDFKQVPLTFTNQGYKVVVVNSGIRRSLVNSEFNTRRAECEEAVALLKPKLPSIKTLRDVEISELDLLNSLPQNLAKRATHVVTENARVLTGIKALEADDLTMFGKLLDASHISLKNDYEVSCLELDLLVELALKQPGVLGARMTGAGFGGCTVQIVSYDQLAGFKENISKYYYAKRGIIPEIYVFTAAKGAGLISNSHIPS